MRVALIVGVLAALSLIIHVGGRAVGRSLSTGGHSISSEIHQVIIGNNLLSVPENMIRFDNQRRGGSHQRLDLYALFPQMSGYTTDTRAWFNNQAPDQRLVFITIDERQMSRDMSGRYEPIYALLTTPAGEADGGLDRRTFLPSSGYTNEALMVTPDSLGEPRFVARCLAGEDAVKAVAACERDIHVGDNLSLTYRFPRSMLENWRALDATMHGFANAIVATSVRRSGALKASRL